MDGHEFAEEKGNLLFGGGAGAGDAHFDFARGVFVDWNVALEGGGDGNALGASKFEHGLYVFAIELGFDGEFVGIISVDDLEGALENALEFEVWVGNFIHVEDAGYKKFRFLAFAVYFDDGVAHEVGAGVNAHNEFFHALRFQLRHC